MSTTNITGSSDLMDISSSSSSSTASTTTPSASDGNVTDVSVFIHPMVLINISDHNLRHHNSFGTNKELSKFPCVGMLFGVQTGLRIEIYSSFEAKFVSSTSSSSSTSTSSSSSLSMSQIPKLDTKFIEDQIKLVTQVYPTYELLGWYSAVDTLTPLYTELHQQWKLFNESPYFIQLAPNLIISSNTSIRKELPIYIYQSQYNNVTNSINFISIPYKLEATESERITIDHVTTATEAQRSTGSDTLAKLQQLKAQSSALKVLAERLATLETFVENVKNDEISLSTPGNISVQTRNLLREISSVCSRVPIGIEHNALFNQQLQRSEEDSLLIAYAASLTKGSNALHDIMEKLNIITRETMKKQKLAAFQGSNTERFAHELMGYPGSTNDNIMMNMLNAGMGMRHRPDPGLSMGRRRRQ